MQDGGYLEHLVDFDQRKGYWEHYLLDYPDHPLARESIRYLRKDSFAATLYGDYSCFSGVPVETLLRFTKYICVLTYGALEV